MTDLRELTGRPGSNAPRRVWAALGGIALAASCASCGALNADLPKPEYNKASASATPNAEAAGAYGASDSGGKQPSNGQLTMTSDGKGNGAGGKQPTEPRKDLPKNASYLAGGPVPDKAAPATSFANGVDGTRYAVLSSPSGNIRCFINNQDNSLCVVAHTAFNPGQDETGAKRNAIKVAGPASPAPQAPAEGLPDTPGQVLPYGGMAHYNGIVCASQKTGMTCWDATTGFGAVVSRGEIVGF